MTDFGQPKLGDIELQKRWQKILEQNEESEHKQKEFHVIITECKKSKEKKCDKDCKYCHGAGKVTIRSKL